MRHFILFCIFLLAGCATQTPYGHFIDHADGDKKMANDAAAQLAILYPPAKTSFVIEQPTPDLFGQTLVKNLRKRGYALAEPGSKDSAAGTTRYQLRYRLDQLTGTESYYLTILVNQEAITRFYARKDGIVAASGAWLHKEGS